jgi:hypothetical protein
MSKIAERLISKIDLSKYVRAVPDKPINAGWPIAPVPVIRMTAGLPTSQTVNEAHNDR